MTYPGRLSLLEETSVVLLFNRIEEHILLPRGVCYAPDLGSISGAGKSTVNDLGRARGFFPSAKFTPFLIY